MPSYVSTISFNVDTLLTVGLSLWETLVSSCHLFVGFRTLVTRLALFSVLKSHVLDFTT